MKHIIKVLEPTEFSGWKALKNDNWQPSYGGNFQNPEKGLVKDALLQEQGFICCYCERELKNTEKLSHIEHFIPQSICHSKALDYDNMLCSCGACEEDGTSTTHCGHLKGNWFDDDLLISPLNPKCETRFMFTGDGSIYPLSDSDEGASVTIEKLGLNISKLKRSRKAAIRGYREKTPQKINCALERDTDGKYQEYWSSIHSLLMP